MTTVSILPSNKTPLNTKPSEAQPASIFHCVGAAVTAIANVITSPKRPQASPVNSSENKRSRPDLSPPKSDNTPTEMSIAEPSLAVKAEEKPIPCVSIIFIALISSYLINMPLYLITYKNRHIAV
ncbi:unnamed protein product [Trichobilharzia regenti]|nr:unnamed protein product [Trichobilharzia regenti]